MKGRSQAQEYKERMLHSESGETEPNYQQGVIENLGASSDGKTVRVSVRHGPKPKPSKRGAPSMNYPPTSEIHTSPSHAKSLRIGQRVQVSFTPADEE